MIQPLSFPRHLLMIYIQLTKSDIKNLRLVHSGMNGLIAPKLLHVIGFNFENKRVAGIKAQRPRRKLPDSTPSKSTLAAYATTFFIDNFRSSEAIPFFCSRLKVMYP